jgi:sortase A
VGRERAVTRHVAEHHGSTPCVVAAPQPGQLAGVLEIPALRLTAPVEEGTTDATLAVAVGHDGTSVWPGTAGTAVLLAHDVSYFVHLDQLQPGDKLVYRTACTTVAYTVTGQQVVQQGTPVPGSSSPTLVLDTCYPPNALFFTTQRLLVTATETSDTAAGAAPAAGAGVTAPAQGQASYTVPAPPALVAQGLTLQQNEAPMGTMTLSGDTSPGWEQSPGPLALEAAALEAYFGGIDSAEQGQTAWWAAIAQPGVAPPVPLRGGEITGHTSPLDVTITSTGGSPSSVALTTTVTVSGGAAPGTYAESVTEPVQGSTVLIGGWSMTPA